MSSPSPAESLVLATLVTQGRPKARPAKIETLARSASLAADEAQALLAALETRGLVERTRTGTWLATAQGAALIPAKEPTPSKPRASRTPTLDPAILLARIEQLERTLLARLDKLEQSMDAPKESPLTQRPEVPELQASVQASVLDLVKERRFGGLVPVPEVRRLVAERSGALPSEVDAVLAELDRAYALDLKVPNDPALANQGFEMPGRGRVYFVVPR